MRGARRPGGEWAPDASYQIHLIPSGDPCGIAFGMADLGFAQAPRRLADTSSALIKRMTYHWQKLRAPGVQAPKPEATMLVITRQT
ncbi:hypothetical protein CFIICLFH_2670 [Methylobacterium goesingense]|uniref:Uncharacterized protein n=1 Tax=Methylobacterium goesingense TaxID=243690 RepID=A0ABV2L011_9HYPH|nr:hypothetical protein CFIICLFH_2670 [Methylobacterium goesingense]